MDTTITPQASSSSSGVSPTTTITSWIAVTTAWPYIPENYCADIYDAQGLSNLGTFSGFGIAFTRPTKAASGTQKLSPCLPDVVTRWWDIENPTLAAPGTAVQCSIAPIVCPEGYISALPTTVSPGTTQIACCPREYTFKSVMPSSVLGQCVSTLSIGQVLGYHSFNTAGADQWVSASTTMASEGTVAAMPVNGFNFAHMSPATAPVIAWQTSRILVPTISVAPVPATQKNSIMRSATTIGIGVGFAIVGFFAIIATVAFLLARRRNAPLRERQGGSIERASSKERKTELTGADQRFEKDPADLKPELSSNRPPNHELPPGSNERVEMNLDGQRFEMDPETQRIEMSSDNAPAEMDAIHENLGTPSVHVPNRRMPKSSIFLFGKKVTGYWTGRR